MASFDSSSSGSRNGLNRYYRQAWENLHESAGSKTGLKVASGDSNSPIRRKETLDEPPRRESSEIEGFGAGKPSEKKRRHHHHHHHDVKARKDERDWRDPKPPPQRDQKRY